MSTTYAAGEPPRVVSAAARLYAKCLLVGFALLPAYLIAYLWFFSDRGVVFENHAFHEIAIAAATLEGAFVTYVTWVCYRSSGEPLLRWLTLGFLGFAMIYALHGAFTGMAHHNIWLFLLYGPASRFVMSALLLTGLLSYSRPPDRLDKRTSMRTWLPWIVFFLIVNVAVAYIAYSPVAGALGTRLSMEGGALVFSLLNVCLLLARRIRSPLMVIYGVSIMAFALSSLAFILGKPWNHMWWLAHAIFAGRILPAQLRRRAGAADDTLVLGDLQPGRPDEPAVGIDGAYRERAAGTAAHEPEARIHGRDRPDDGRVEPPAVHRAGRA